MDRRMDGQWTDRRTEQVERWTSKLIERRTNGHVDRWTDRQRGGRIDKVGHSNAPLYFSSLT
jgi:hypothetical protein